MASHFENNQESNSNNNNNSNVFVPLITLVENKEKYIILGIASIILEIPEITINRIGLD